MTSVTRKELAFPSSDGTTTLRGYVWSSRKKPRAIVQIVHGMAEHIARYDDFANYLADKGYIVCGHDQIGHGMSCEDPKMRGCLPAERGKDIMVSDVCVLRKLMQCEKGAELPYFIFGHSLGSYITRCYIGREGTGLAGAIICGTGTVEAALSKVANFLSRSISKLRGETYISGLLDNLGVGAYAKAIENAETSLDWLSYNKNNVAAYAADELSGFPFSAGGYATVTALTAEACDINTAKRVPMSLPLLYIAGDGDPVGSMGKGVEQAAELARKAGSSDVSVHIYDHMRHEILNEDDHERVYNDVYDWIEARRDLGK